MKGLEKQSFPLTMGYTVVERFVGLNNFYFHLERHWNSLMWYEVGRHGRFESMGDRRQMVFKEY
jgi:hypothetical protein